MSHQETKVVVLDNDKLMDIVDKLDFLETRILPKLNHVDKATEAFSKTEKIERDIQKVVDMTLAIEEKIGKLAEVANNIQQEVSIKDEQATTVDTIAKISKANRDTLAQIRELYNALKG